MPIELRWAVPPDTTTERPILQWREVDEDAQGEFIIRDWTTVPVIVVDSEEGAYLQCLADGYECALRARQQGEG